MHADCSAPVRVDASVCVCVCVCMCVYVCVRAWCLRVRVTVGSKITIDLRVYPRTSFLTRVQTHTHTSLSPPLASVLCLSQTRLKQLKPLRLSFPSFLPQIKKEIPLLLFLALSRLRYRANTCRTRITIFLKCREAFPSYVAQFGVLGTCHAPQ